MTKPIEQAIQQMRISRGWDKTDTPEILAKSIVVEAAELLECYQWSNEANLQDVKAEVADVLMYVISLCMDLGWDYEQVILEKMEDVKKRYPHV